MESNFTWHLAVEQFKK